jgi:hypothetical protein
MASVRMDRWLWAARFFNPRYRGAAEGRRREQSVNVVPTDDHQTAIQADLLEDYSATKAASEV